LTEQLKRRKDLFWLMVSEVLGRKDCLFPCPGQNVVETGEGPHLMVDRKQGKEKGQEPGITFKVTPPVTHFF
jgi:hypothetical protein